MSEDRIICPLFSTYSKQDDCVEKYCGFWSREDEVCCFVSIQLKLSEISDQLQILNQLKEGKPE